MGKELEVPVCLHNLHVHQTMTRINLTGRLRTAAVNRALALQGAKLQHGHIPLYVRGDDENTRQFPSLHAVQRHMADTGRFKMAWEDNEDEYEDFYNFDAVPMEDAEAGQHHCQAHEETSVNPGSNGLYSSLRLDKSFTRGVSLLDTSSFEACMVQHYAQHYQHAGRLAFLGICNLN